MDNRAPFFVTTLQGGAHAFRFPQLHPCRVFYGPSLLPSTPVPRLTEKNEMMTMSTDDGDMDINLLLSRVSAAGADSLPLPRPPPPPPTLHTETSLFQAPDRTPPSKPTAAPATPPASQQQQQQQSSILGNPQTMTLQMQMPQTAMLMPQQTQALQLVQGPNGQMLLVQAAAPQPQTLIPVQTAHGIQYVAVQHQAQPQPQFAAPAGTYAINTMGGLQLVSSQQPALQLHAVPQQQVAVLSPPPPPPRGAHTPAMHHAAAHHHHHAQLQQQYYHAHRQPVHQQQQQQALYSQPRAQPQAHHGAPPAYNQLPHSAPTSAAAPQPSTVAQRSAPSQPQQIQRSPNHLHQHAAPQQTSAPVHASQVSPQQSKHESILGAPPAQPALQRPGLGQNNGTAPANPTVPEELSSAASGSSNKILAPIDGPEHQLNPRAEPFIPPSQAQPTASILGPPSLAPGETLPRVTSPLTTAVERVITPMNRDPTPVASAAAPPPPVAIGASDEELPQTTSSGSLGSGAGVAAAASGPAPPSTATSLATHPGNPMFVIPARCVTKQGDRPLYRCPMCDERGFLSEYVVRSHLRAKHGSDSSFLVRLPLAQKLAVKVREYLAEGGPANGGSAAVADVLEHLPEDLAGEIRDATHFEALLGTQEDFIVFQYTDEELELHKINASVADTKQVRVALMNTPYCKRDASARQMHDAQ